MINWIEVTPTLLELYIEDFRCTIDIRGPDYVVFIEKKDQEGEWEFFNKSAISNVPLDDLKKHIEENYNLR